MPPELLCRHLPLRPASVVAGLALVSSAALAAAVDRSSVISLPRELGDPLTVTRATSEVTVDGVLDEAAWADALAVALAYEWRPGDGVAPPVETDGLITYDDRNLYVAFRAYDPDPSAIRAHLMDRDDTDTLVQDDHVVVIIDAYNDQRRAVQLRVNPLGVQADAITSENEGIEDFAWDILWDSAGRITDEGYVIEIAVPLSQLRFPPGDEVQTWIVDLGRSYPRNERHRMTAHYIDRDRTCGLCQAPRVTGFEGLRPGLNLELTPTLTATRSDAAVAGPGSELEDGEEDFEPGLSARWGISPNMTLSATLNPDFSQVEADVAQLEVNQRFALFFPEQRPFFLEGVDLFSTPIRAVFTRSIADPDWGLKLTGKEGKNSYGVFAAADSVTNLLLPSNQGSRGAFLDQEALNGVLRYRRDVGANSSLGALYTGREGDGYHNRVAGIDGRYRFDDRNTVRFQYLASDTRYPAALAGDLGLSADTFSGRGFMVDYDYGSRDWDASIEYWDYDAGFRADTGFIRRNDFRELSGFAGRSVWGDEDDWYSQLFFGFFGQRVEDQTGRLTDQKIDLFANFQGPLQSFAEISLERNRTFFGGVDYEDLERAQLYGEFQPTGSAKLAFFVDVGDSIDVANNQAADLLLLNPRVEVKMGRHLNLQLRHSRQTLDVEGGQLFEVNLSQLRAVYQLNIRTFVRAVIQYQTLDNDPALFSFPVVEEEQRLFSQWLFSYKLNARTVLFAGYSDTRRGTADLSLEQTGRTFFLKLGYAWVR